MDYHSIHGHDVSSFDLPSTHRLPTVSAAQALQDFEGNDSNFVSTGLAGLDTLLGSGLDDRTQGGIQKGHVTEVWGPPGVGKTTFGIQLAANSLRNGKRVVWVDGFHPVSVQRLRDVVGPTAEADGGADSQLEALTHYTCPTLPHFIALLCRPTAACVPEGTSLVVVDSLSALINHSFPRAPEGRGAGDIKGSKGPPLSARRLQVLQYIVGALQKLAATRDVAIVILSQCATKMQAERGATLIPAVNATVWDQGISTRLVLFRDWAPDAAESRALHFVGVQKRNGKSSNGVVEGIFAFRIETGGLVSVDCDDAHSSRALSATPAPKRKLAATNFEIADSEDEDYGWDDDDDALPPMPSQWQGSEDILLRPPPESEQPDDDGHEETTEPEEEVESVAAPAGVGHEGCSQVSQ